MNNKLCNYTFLVDYHNKNTCNILMKISNQDINCKLYLFSIDGFSLKLNLFMLKLVELSLLENGYFRM